MSIQGPQASIREATLISIVETDQVAGADPEVKEWGAHIERSQCGMRSVQNFFLCESTMHSVQGGSGVMLP